MRCDTGKHCVVQNCLVCGADDIGYGVCQELRPSIALESHLGPNRHHICDCAACRNSWNDNGHRNLGICDCGRCSTGFCFELVRNKNGLDALELENPEPWFCGILVLWVVHHNGRVVGAVVFLCRHISHWSPGGREGLFSRRISSGFAHSNGNISFAHLCCCN